jgi:hypothetical protein
MKWCFDAHMRACGRRRRPDPHRVLQQRPRRWVDFNFRVCLALETFGSVCWVPSSWYYLCRTGKDIAGNSRHTFWVCSRPRGYMTHVWMEMSDWCKCREFACGTNDRFAATGANYSLVHMCVAGAYKGTNTSELQVCVVIVYVWIYLCLKSSTHACSQFQLFTGKFVIVSLWESVNFLTFICIFS